MADLLITDIPDEVLERLAARAAREHKTVEDVAREALVNDREDNPLQRLSRDIRSMSPPAPSDWDAAEVVREERSRR